MSDQNELIINWLEAYSAACTDGDMCKDCNFADLCDRLDQSAPAVIAEALAVTPPERTGRWLDFINDHSTAECSQCGEIYEVSPDEEPREEYFNAFKQCYKYCPNCGCKMKTGGNK